MPLGWLCKSTSKAISAPAFFVIRLMELKNPPTSSLLEFDGGRSGYRPQVTFLQLLFLLLKNLFHLLGGHIEMKIDSSD